MTLPEIIPVLQVAVGPVILISGVGLLLLTMTNRLGRAIDRARHLARDAQECSNTARPGLMGQIDIIYRRARLLRLTIGLAVLSVLLAALLVIALFLSALFGQEHGLAIALLFIVCLGALIASLIAFLYDIHLSLMALRLELKPVNPDLH